MRILYFGIFERPFDTEVFISKSLKALGHTVVEIPMVKCELPDVKALLNNQDFDFILFSKGWFKEDNEAWVSFFQDRKRQPIPTVGWFFDLAWGTTREWQITSHMAFRSDIVCTTDGGHEDKFKAAGINHHVLRQGIFEPEAYMAEPQGEENIVFVGTSVHAVFNWPFREELLTWLGKTYPDHFRWYGRNDGIRNAALNTLYASTKVVVGDSVYSPEYWSNRLYETIGRGGFLIFPEVPGIEKDFTPYKHFIPYTPYDWEGLREKIDYYLTHDKEREAIRKAGFEHCKANHTYTKRCEKLIEIVNDYKRRMGYTNKGSK